MRGAIFDSAMRPVVIVLLDPASDRCSHFFQAPILRCPSCDEELQVPSLYYRTLAVSSILLSLPLPPLLGIRGTALFFAELYGWIPVWLLAIMCVKLFIPPKLQRHYPKDPEIPTLFPRR